MVDVARAAIARQVDGAGHVVEDPADEEDVPLVPPKPRSEDVEEPEVHVDASGEHDAPEAAEAAADADADGDDPKKDQ